MFYVATKYLNVDDDIPPNIKQSIYSLFRVWYIIHIWMFCSDIHFWMLTVPELCTPIVLHVRNSEEINEYIVRITSPMKCPHWPVCKAIQYHWILDGYV